MKLQEQMLRVLSAAQADRKLRPDMVMITDAWGHHTQTPAWNVHEMNVMLNEVNTLRAAKCLPLVSLNDIQKVESMACGHSDYSHKFALYCAELTFKSEKEIQP